MIYVLTVFSIINFILLIILLMKASQAVTELTDLRTQLTKVRGEVATKTESLNARIAALEEIVNNSSDPELPAAVADVIAGLKSDVQGLDDLNPDAPAPENPPAEPENPPANP